MTEKHYGYVYTVKNVLNDMVYVGRRKGNVKRSYFGSGTYIKRAVNKYGAHNFLMTPMASASSEEELNEIEKLCIGFFRFKLGRKRVYNLQNGGHRGHGYRHTKERIRAIRKMFLTLKSQGKGWKKGSRHSEETKKGLSLQRKGNKFALGYRFSDAQKKAFSVMRKGVAKSEEHKRKISESNKGQVPWILGKHHSKETREKIRISNILTKRGDITCLDPK